MLVAFPAQGTRPGRSSTVGSRLRLARSRALVATVPSRAVSGHIYVVDRYGRRSNRYGPIYVVRHRRPLGGSGVTSAPVTGSPFEGLGMWIWYLSKSEGGDLNAIVARARSAGIRTVFIKSSDGSTNYWSQFSAATVAALKAAGLHVCAWQYVYGSKPTGEADLGIEAARAGAECLVIDAEAEYEGRYAAAQTYLQALRGALGAAFPIGLASFPYVDYHPSEPYSVFLGPGGAQYDAPQMYWKDIGTSVDAVYAHTFTHNRIYQRPIFPLGQTYSNPSTADLERFRAESGAYGFGGLSFWDWQETTSSGWAALAAPLAPLTGFAPSTGWPVLRVGAKGDEVVWMQEHLASVAPSTKVDGYFGASTQTTLEQFQSDHGLPVTGEADAATWPALLALAPVAVSYNGSPATSTGSSPSASAASVRRRRVAPPPVSARLPDVAREIPRVG